MKKKIQKYLSGEREGFSLIELIIVIAIMAILIGVIALVVLPYLESARENRDRQTLSEVSNAFKSAMSNEKVAAKVEAAASAYKEPTAIQIDTGKTLEDYMRKYMDGKISDTTDETSAVKRLASKNCKDKKFYVKATKSGDNYELKVCISADGSTVAEDSEGKKYEQ